jgi:hypothetical protein
MNAKMVETCPDYPLTCAEDWILMRKNHVFNFDVVSELADGGRGYY